MWSILVLLLIFISTLASPFGRHVMHEKRDKIPIAWKQVKRIEPYHTLPARIALKQSNLDKLEYYLMDVSDPLSANYGKHWSAQEVASKFAPTEESVKAVITWLSATGIAPEEISQSSDGGWIQFHTTVGELEQLLQTEYYQYSHVSSGVDHVACIEYSVPLEVRHHIDFITPTVHFDVRVNGAPSHIGISSRESTSGSTSGINTCSSGLGCPGNSWLPKIGKNITQAVNTLKLEQCVDYTTPICLQTLYNMTIYTTDVSELRPTPNNSFGVVAYSPQQYNPPDFTLFTSVFGPPGPLGLLSAQILAQPVAVFINGLKAIVTGLLAYVYGTEGNLDVCYGMTLAYPEVVQFIEVSGNDSLIGDLLNTVGPTFNTLLEAYDASYPPDPTTDPTGPNVAAGGYTPPKILSTSYGIDEVDYLANYERRMCNEYGKLGMMGTTVLYASGDYGVAGNGGTCLSNATGSAVRFNPAFPATCPWVTAVGATQTVKSLVAGQGSTDQPEIACNSTIYSGGGFSNVFPMPAYQQAAIADYLKSPASPSKLGIRPDQYNSTGSRGYPDISANGANFVVPINGVFLTVYGTSAATPTIGAILALINADRLNMGLPPLGFINPSLYANATGMLNDIVTGTNGAPNANGPCGTAGCCGGIGYSATQGWDPVTGLGTPNFGKMVAAFTDAGTK